MDIGSALEDTKPRTSEAVLLPEQWRRNSLKPGAAALAPQEPHGTTTAHPDSAHKTSHTLLNTLHTQHVYMVEQKLEGCNILATRGTVEL